MNADEDLSRPTDNNQVQCQAKAVKSVKYQVTYSHQLVLKLIIRINFLPIVMNRPNLFLPTLTDLTDPANPHRPHRSCRSSPTSPILPILTDLTNPADLHQHGLDHFIAAYVISGTI